jgi:hypothetical protein
MKDFHNGLGNLAILTATRTFGLVGVVVKAAAADFEKAAEFGCAAKGIFEY